VRTSVALLVFFALFVTTCSSAELERRSGATESGTEVHRSAAPVTGMDGRPPVEVAASSGPPPGWIGGSGGPGPSGPPAAIVPDVTGVVFADAVHRLWQSGISFRLVHARDSDRTLWSVIEQNPLPGSDTPDSGKIDLVLSMPVQGNTGTGVAVLCRPSAANLADPYCLGKLLKY
jgi:hypothetical protein